MLLPYIDRSHSTYGASMNPLTPDKVSGASVGTFGDMRFITSYQGFLPTHNLGFQLGLILPTGDYGGPDAAGTGTVGRNPVAFNSGPNSQIPSPGNLLDTSLQAGAGATDLIVGAYYYQAVSQNFDAFINGQFQAALWHKLDQPGEDYHRQYFQCELRRTLRGEPHGRSAAAIQHHQQAHDTECLPTPFPQAARSYFLSPGLSVSVAHDVQVYAFVQLPIYSNLTGYQLFPHWTGSGGELCLLTCHGQGCRVLQQSGQQTAR